MIIPDLCLVLANTVRSRAYVQTLFQNKLYPALILLLPGEEPIKRDIPKSIEVPIASFDGQETETFVFKPFEELRDTLQQHQQAFSVLDNRDINSKEVTGQIKRMDPRYFVYSGYSRVLVNADLAASKNVIHVHGGYLPAYKGATGFYYGLLEKGFLGQSAILIDQGIDTGKIIKRKQYKVSGGIDIDYVYDPVTRANLLKEVVREFGNYVGLALQDNEEGVMHYVIHPALKFIAIHKGAVSG